MNDKEFLRSVILDVFNQVVSEAEDVDYDTINTDKRLWYYKGFVEGAVEFCDELMSRIEGGYEVPEDEQD